MLFKQFLFARNIAAVTLRQHVLAHGLDVFTGNNVGADRSLNRHIVHLPGDQFAQAGGDFATAVGRVAAVNDHAERIHLVAIDEQIHFHNVG